MEDKKQTVYKDIKKDGGILQLSQIDVIQTLTGDQIDMSKNSWLKRIRKNFGDSKVRLYEVINNGLEVKGQKVSLTKGDRVQLFLI